MTGAARDTRIAGQGSELEAGMRIGKILALGWKHLDLLRGSIEVLETGRRGKLTS